MGNKGAKWEKEENKRGKRNVRIYLMRKKFNFSYFSEYFRLIQEM